MGTCTGVSIVTDKKLWGFLFFSFYIKLRSTCFIESITSCSRQHNCASEIEEQAKHHGFPFKTSHVIHAN